ncbi:ABC transporter ATP-binding protein [Eubacterium sp. AF17-7]|uniref:ABC transporter ATP-binding protein n=1 Tax=Eubacterium sp. AF17-7 TaxID=2293105 RepID=UPI000E4DE8F0|nr:ABC transporter ATP-binding protein [Eubacterium sp. AF17-7]RGG66432.1 ABC transporter ATP-binding protein [Eubacterium sp. AF17-7]
MKEKTLTQKQALEKVIKHIKKYWYLLGGSLFFALVYVALSLYVPIQLGNATDLILGRGKVDFTEIGLIAVKIAAFTLIAAFAQWIMNNCNNKITYNVVRDIREETFEHLQKLPLKYIDSHSNGETVSKIITDVDQLADGLLMGFSQLFTGMVTIVLTLVFMLTISIKITLVVVLVTPVSLFVAKFIATRTYSMFKKQSETRAKQTALIDEIIGNGKIVRAFGREDEVVEQFDEINEDLRKYYLKGTFFSSITNPSTRFVNSLVYAGVAISGGIIAITGGITVGNLQCILSYANQYTKPFNEISGVVTELQNAIACAGRVFALLEEEAEIENKDAIDIENVSGSVELDHVNFSYTPDKKLIEDLNLCVEPGKMIAIVGPTGCGKTTIINLLMRFYDVNSGKITMDSHNIKDITRKSLRKSYGMVLQETWLKNGTIRDNIAMGKEDATLEEVIEAAKLSHAHSFIKRLPNGYDTVIGDDGGNLSQGQKQLLCIARVMLCLPPMLILDEATSSIDTRTEIRIQKAFAKMMKGRTTFIVAHRLSTIKEADTILVMNDGKIIEQGNHNQLLANKGFYYELYNNQFSSVNS